MAKVQSLNDSFSGVVAQTYKTGSVDRDVVTPLIEEAQRKDKWLKNLPEAPKKIVFRKVDGKKVPFILKGSTYVPMTLKVK